MNYLIGFTVEELEELLAQCKEEMLNGSVTQINSLGTSAAFTKMPVERRMELIIASLQLLKPEQYGQRIKTARARFI